MSAKEHRIPMPKGGEFVFYAKPLTVGQRSEAMKQAKDDAQRFGLQLLIAKAEDASGGRCFTAEDLHALRHKLPTSVIDLITVAILGKEEEAEDTDSKSEEGDN